MAELIFSQELNWITDLDSTRFTPGLQAAGQIYTATNSSILDQIMRTEVTLVTWPRFIPIGTRPSYSSPVDISDPMGQSSLIIIL